MGTREQVRDDSLNRFLFRFFFFISMNIIYSKQNRIESAIENSDMVKTYHLILYSLLVCWIARVKCLKIKFLNSNFMGNIESHPSFNLTRDWIVFVHAHNLRLFILYPLKIEYEFVLQKNNAFLMRFYEILSDLVNRQTN